MNILLRVSNILTSFVSKDVINIIDNCSDRISKLTKS